MTGLQDDLHDAWSDLSDAIGERDVEHERRAWALIQQLQQRTRELSE